MNINLISELGELTSLFTAVLILFGLKLYVDFRFKEAQSLILNNNVSVSIRRFGLYFGVSLALLGAVWGSSLGLCYDIVSVLVFGLLSVILILVSQRINDCFLLHSINNKESVKNNNISVALVEASSFIATGLIIKSCIQGTMTVENFSAQLLSGVGIAVAYFAIGQIILLAFAKIYQLITPFDDQKLISEGNVPAGLTISGSIVALGYILSVSMLGESATFTAGLLSFLFFAVKGVILLVIIELIADKLFLPKKKITDAVTENLLAPIIIITAIKISLALLIGVSVL